MTSTILPGNNARWIRLGAIGGAVVLVLILLVGSYNGLVDREARVDQTVADLEVQLQRRFDLIPNLVSAVEAALEQEREIIADVTEARTRYAGAASSDDKVAAGAALEGA
ncbi:MAG: hypothetical protein RL330_408, partial [Actinomycetota bacterium]